MEMSAPAAEKPIYFVVWTMARHWLSANLCIWPLPKDQTPNALGMGED